MGGQRHAPAALPPERPGTHCIVGWVGPRTGLEGCGKSRFHRHSILGPSESLYRLRYPGPPCPMDTGGIAGRGMKLTTHLRLVSRLRKSGTVPLHFWHAFVTWSAATLPLTSHKGSEGRDCGRTRRLDTPSSVLLCIRQIMCVKIPARHRL